MVTTYSTDRQSALSGVTSISNSFISEYMQDAPKRFLEVYLFALMQYQNPSFANDDISLALKMSDEEITAAFDYWQKKGVLRIVRFMPLHIEFTRASSHYTSDGKYANLIESLRPVLGTRVLSATDLKCIYDWIEVFGLSEDAVEALFIYCINTKGIKTSVQYMDSVARTWAENSILTAEDAKEYIANHTLYYKGAHEILKRFNIRRQPTQDEVELYKKWVYEYKLPHEIIIDACASLTSATSPSFAYLAKVIDSYIENGATTTEALLKLHKETALFEDFCKELFKTARLSSKPNAAQKEKIKMWLETLHMPKELLLMLAKHAQANVQPFAFISKRVHELNEKDIHNVADAEKELASFAQNKQQGYAGGNYIQRNYSEADLKKLGIDFGDDD